MPDNASYLAMLQNTRTNEVSWHSPESCHVPPAYNVPIAHHPLVHQCSAPGPTSYWQTRFPVMHSSRSELLIDLAPSSFKHLMPCRLLCETLREIRSSSGWNWWLWHLSSKQVTSKTRRGREQLCEVDGWDVPCSSCTVDPRSLSTWTPHSSGSCWMNSAILQRPTIALLKPTVSSPCCWQRASRPRPRSVLIEDHIPQLRHPVLKQWSSGQTCVRTVLGETWIWRSRLLGNGQFNIQRPGLNVFVDSWKVRILARDFPIG